MENVAKNIFSHNKEYRFDYSGILYSQCNSTVYVTAANNLVVHHKKGTYSNHGDYVSVIKNSEVRRLEQQQDNGVIKWYKFGRRIYDNTLVSKYIWSCVSGSPYTSSSTDVEITTMICEYFGISPHYIETVP